MRTITPKFPLFLFLDGESDIEIVNPQIIGGECCINLHKCRNVIVKGGNLANPTITWEAWLARWLAESGRDPKSLSRKKTADLLAQFQADPETHHILMDQCDDCHAINVTTDSTNPTGDSINIFNCCNCSADGCTINGPLAAMACAAIIDGPDGIGNCLTHLTINSPAGRVGICGGSDHCLCDTHVPGAVEVTGEYYPGGKVIDAKLVRVTGPELYVGRGVLRLTEKACRFKASAERKP